MQKRVMDGVEGCGQGGVDAMLGVFVKKVIVGKMFGVFVEKVFGVLVKCAEKSFGVLVKCAEKSRSWVVGLLEVRLGVWVCRGSVCLVVG